MLAAGDRLPSDGTGAILFSDTDVMISLIATLISPCKSCLGFSVRCYEKPEQTYWPTQ